MTPKMESPAASGKANGAENKADHAFCYTITPRRDFATFEHVSVAAYRVAHLVARANVDPARAAILSGLIFGEGQI